MQSLQALLRRVLEPGAESIVNRQWLDLSSISLLVNDDGRVDVGSVKLPVLDLVVDNSVVGIRADPVGPGEALLHAILGVFVGEAKLLMGTL